MNKLLVSLVVAASLSVPAAGFMTVDAMAATMTKPAMTKPAPVVKPAPAKPAPAAWQTSVGKIVAVSAKFHTVTLANEGVFVFGKGVNLSKVTVGDWATITWTKGAKFRVATKIVTAKTMKPADMMKTMMMNSKMKMPMMAH